MKKIIRSLRGNLFFNMIVLLVISFSVVAVISCWVGYTSFSSTLSEAYNEYALSAAKIAEEYLDADKLYSYIEKWRNDKAYNAETDPDYKDMKGFLQYVCDSHGMTFMYIVEVGKYDRYASYTAKTKDDVQVGYGWYDVVMEVVGWNYSKDNPDAAEGRKYSAWKFGDNTSVKIEYSRMYRALYEGETDKAFLPRPYSGDETGGPHTSTLIPLKGADGKVKLVLVATRAMDLLDDGRGQYLFKAITITVVLMALIGALTAVVIRRNFVIPVRKITDEARRFTVENSPSDESLDSRLPTNLSDLKTLAKAIDTMEEENLEYVRSITTMTGENERISTELHIAKLIQEGAIPSIFPAFPERKEIDLFGSMTPAKEVGGDFYDFYFIDDDHLLMVMADVSGKGIPAALFMMVTKILISDRALMGGSPSEILAFVNDRICKNNIADMFVTVWLGILELSTGRLVSANAGHENPAIYRSGGEFSFNTEKHGFVLGGLPGVKYRDVEYKLSPGDKLFLYTDGVTEATDSSESMFGADRLLSSLNASGSGSPKEVLEGVKGDIDAFVGDAPQFDDLTMLCIELCGGESRSFGASLEELDNAMGFLDGFLEEKGCPMKIMTQIDLSFEELFVNVANYGYPDGDGEVEVRLSENDGVAEITLIDGGVEYDPLKKPDPDVSLSADKRPIGGLGVYLVKKNMDSVEYRYENGKNILVMTKRIR